MGSDVVMLKLCCGNWHEETLFKAVLCLNMSKINYSGLDSESLNQHWLTKSC